MAFFNHTKMDLVASPRMPPLDPAGGVKAGGWYDSVWTRDSFFSLLGVDAKARPIEYRKLAARLWHARKGDHNHLPFIFGSTVRGGSNPQYLDEKTRSEVADSNAICVLAAAEGQDRGLVAEVSPALEWYAARRPDGLLVVEGRAASWEDSMAEPPGPVAYTNALVYAAMVQVARVVGWSSDWPPRDSVRAALLSLIEAGPCAVSIGILVRWGDCVPADFAGAIEALVKTGPYQKHRIERKGACGAATCAPWEPLWFMRLVRLGGYHTEARWPWTQLFLAGCLKNAEMGRAWHKLYLETGKLYETYAVEKNKPPRRFWFLAPDPFSMNVGTLRFYLSETHADASDAVFDYNRDPEIQAILLRTDRPCPARDPPPGGRAEPPCTRKRVSWL